MAVIPPPNEQWELFSDTPVSYRDGRDELNLAEFPISTIGNRADPNIKTISFEDQAVDKDTGESIYRQLTITASDKYGLPTATDDEVLLGLLQISRWQRFASQTVAFTPYQLIKLLGWSISTNNYRRLRDSIERWLGVTLHYVNAWRDKQTRSLDRCRLPLHRIRQVLQAGRTQQCSRPGGPFRHPLERTGFPQPARRQPQDPRLSSLSHP